MAPAAPDRPGRHRAQGSRQDVSGVRSEPAEVWLNDGRPARFVWRGRLYTVLSVIERPAGGPHAGQHYPGEPDPGEPDRGEPDRGEPDPGEGDPAMAAWQCWRVTASPGKNVPAAMYQLCHDTSADRWLLSRNGR